MSDAEVVRLQQLRYVALSTRALASALIADPARRNSVISRSAVTCWRIARVISGTLQAHPFLGYQRGPGKYRCAYDRAIAGISGAVARYRGRGLQVLSHELQHVVRGLDDARALTHSAELSETLGRLQIQIRGLIAEQDCSVRAKAQRQPTPLRTDIRTEGVRDGAGSVDANWPYLAF